MALYLTSLRRCNSLVSVSSRNQHGNRLYRKPPAKTVASTLKETSNCDCSALAVHWRPNHRTRTLDFIDTYPGCAPLLKSNDSLLNLRDYSFNFGINKKVQNEITLCAKECKAYKEVQKESGSNPGKANSAQVQYIYEELSRDLPNLFIKAMNYKIYHQDIIFENNIRGTKTVGKNNYIKQIALLKTVGHLKFSAVKLDILKITANPEDGTVRVRWRIRGVSNYRVLFSFFKLSFSTKNNETEGWYDGFSIFYVRSDGLVHKHVADKMIPDNEEKISSIGNHLAAKMFFAKDVAQNFSPSILLCEQKAGA